MKQTWLVLGAWLLASAILVDTNGQASSWETTSNTPNQQAPAWSTETNSLKSIEGQSSSWNTENNGQHQKATAWSTESNSPRPVYISPSEGPQYLASMINQLHTERTQIMGPTPVPDQQGPPSALSHGQLSALYQNGVKQNSDGENLVDSQGGNEPGYYYYYYPNTELPDENSTENNMDMNDIMSGDEKNPEPKHVEPLFVAMASFIGLSTLFAFSVLFLPKFGSRKRSKQSAGLTPLTRSVLTAIEEGPERRSGTPFNNTTETAVEQIEEQEEKSHEGCSARITCEVGKVLRKMQLHQGPLRALERILPSEMGIAVQRVREAAHRRDKCSRIRCHND